MFKLIMILVVISFMAHPVFSDKQAKFYYNDLHDFNILSGVTGSGKSFVANLKAYQMICTAKHNSKFILSGNTSESLYDNVTAKLLEFDMGIGWLEYVSLENKRRLIVKPTGTQIKCIGANNEKSQDRIQGENVDGWYADEIVKQPESFIEMASSRCRQVKDNKLVVSPILWTCNPGSPSHVIKTDYIDKEVDKDVINWYFGFRDNPLIDEAYIVKQRQRFSGVFYQRMIEGKWVAAEGSIYALNRSKQIVEGYPKERIVEYVLGVDWGYENPMALVLMAKTGDNKFFVIDELYLKHQLVDGSLKQIMKTKWGHLPISSCYADPSRPDLIYQMQEILESVWPAVIVSAAQNDVIPGIQEVQRYFICRKNDEYGIYFVNKCVNTIREVENYRWKNNAKKDEPLKENDHCPDAIRYPLYSIRELIKFDPSDTLESKAKTKIEVTSTASRIKERLNRG